MFVSVQRSFQPALGFAWRDRGRVRSTVIGSADQGSLFVGSVRGVGLVLGGDATMARVEVDGRRVGRRFAVVPGAPENSIVRGVDVDGKPVRPAGD